MSSPMTAFLHLLNDAPLLQKMQHQSHARHQVRARGNRIYHKKNEAN